MTPELQSRLDQMSVAINGVGTRKERQLLRIALQYLRREIETVCACHRTLEDGRPTLTPTAPKSLAAGLADSLVALEVKRKTGT